MPTNLVELVDPSDDPNVAYPSIVAQLAGLLLAGWYLDDELVSDWLTASAKLEGRGAYAPHELPPVLRRYLDAVARGVRPSHMRVNGRRLRKYTTAKRDHLIATLVGNATLLERERGVTGAIARAKSDATALLDLKPSYVQARWKAIPNANKRRGRPKKISPGK